MRLFAISACLLACLAACNTPKTVVAPEMEERQLDTLVVTAPAIEPDEEISEAMEEVAEEPSYELPVYRASQTRTNDLIHTTLDLAFDWENEQVIGKATLTLQPVFRPQTSVTLDAKGFEFKEIRMANGTSPQPYKYDEEGGEVTIQLDKSYNRGETYQIYIDYVATPEPDGGSAAITSDQGLFFINPRGEDPDKPQQIWTQGETEHNSRWFPTIDQPNERCTQEMFLTVEDKYKTLSNGLLVGSRQNEDGTRTDHWKMNLPHAPYLFMVAIGEFAVVEDEPWNGITVDYYVEPEYEEHAEDIFPYTPEMLTFFSEVTGVDYPWPKYSQVIVRDYVSGAMENTTGVIFGDFMYGTDRELIDVDINEKIVAHEMFHHWFGDLVTCESWSNLTLNEGFANYSEYLWLEHQHGVDAAEMHRIDEQNAYVGSVQRGEPHELIWYDYDNAEQMFDAHSYNKGGLVLHMLRGYLGDELFFAGFEKYLSDNQYSAVEVDELRMAYEDLSGQDLQWFFDQWYLSAGHPELTIDYDYLPESNEVTVRVRQTQSTDNNVPPIFQLPTQVAIYKEGRPTRYEDVMVNERDQTFTFTVGDEPDLVVFDPEFRILSERLDSYDEEEFATLYQVGDNGTARYEGMRNLDPSTEVGRTLFQEALTDPEHELRQVAMNRLGIISDVTVDRIREIAKNDPHSGARAQAIEMLTEAEDDQLSQIAASAAMDQQAAFPVVAAGLSALASTNLARAAEIAQEMVDQGVDNEDMIAAIGAVYAAEGSPERLPYFEDRLTQVDGPASIEFYATYLSLLEATGDESAMANGLDRMQEVGTNQGLSPYVRFATARVISEFHGEQLGKLEEASEEDQEVIENRLTRLEALFQAIEDAESIPDLKRYLERFRPQPRA
ncbi:MAG: M1 family aminopeptidase [Bacteroidota bacterium]